MESQPQLDMRKCIAWGFSAGGYYAIRVAHTHHSRLAGSIGQGAGTHLFLSREWLEHVDDHEYPFVLSEAYVAKYGYKDWEELREKAQKDYSLVESGLLDGPSCRLLLVNGTWDGLMPIEDSMLLMNMDDPRKPGSMRRCCTWDTLLRMSVSGPGWSLSWPQLRGVTLSESEYESTPTHTHPWEQIPAILYIFRTSLPIHRIPLWDTLPMFLKGQVLDGSPVV